MWGLGVYSLGVLWGCLVCKGVGLGVYSLGVLWGCLVCKGVGVGGL